MAHRKENNGRRYRKGLLAVHNATNGTRTAYGGATARCPRGEVAGPMVGGSSFHEHTHACAHTRTRAQPHTHTHTHSLSLSSSRALPQGSAHGHTGLQVAVGAWRPHGVEYPNIAAVQTELQRGDVYSLIWLKYSGVPHTHMRARAHTHTCARAHARRHAHPPITQRLVCGAVRGCSAVGLCRGALGL